jgi:putative FmdB family regulatory protein
MPIYEYVCSKCGKPNEILQKFNDPTPEQCEACGARHTLSRMVSRSSFVLRGGGWYSDLYASTKKPAADSPKDGKELKDAKEPKDTKEPKDAKEPKGERHAKEQQQQKGSTGESKKSAPDSPPASSPAKSDAPRSTSKKNEKAS